MKKVYEQLVQLRSQGRKSLAVLIDPDKTDHLPRLLELAKTSPPDLFFIGGSLLSEGNLESCIAEIRTATNVPVVLFPGSVMQVTPAADAVLLLSVLSGRNPELLIGRHVTAAPMLKQSGLEIISTGYLLIESGASTTVSYISNTQPIPRDKNAIAVCTALAGEQLGMKLIYLEAGSGAKLPVPPEMVAAVRGAISVPLITGGGLRTPEEIAERCRAGADVIVAGNVLEENPGLLPAFCETVHSF